MGFLNRLFGKKTGASEAADADRARSQKLADRTRQEKLAGRETGQTAEEQAGTRGRMEAELLGQRQRREAPATVTATPEAEAAPCPHTTLTPRWESVADMGKEDRVTSYTCQGCNESFTAAEGQALKRHEAERVQATLAEPE